MLPERLVHWSGGVIPGAYAGQMGAHRDPWFIEASPYGNPFWRGAYPEYTFPNETKNPPASPDQRTFQAPSLTLPGGAQPAAVAWTAWPAGPHRPAAAKRWMRRPRPRSSIAIARRRHLACWRDAKVRRAFDVTNAADCNPGTLRAQFVRLVAPHGLPAGRGRRESRAGEPWQQRDVGHARRRVPAI